MRPRSRVIPVVVSSSVLAAKLPRVTTTLGSTSRIWASSQGRQAAISSGSGSRFCRGLQLWTTPPVSRGCASLHVDAEEGDIRPVMVGDVPDIGFVEEDLGIPRNRARRVREGTRPSTSGWSLYRIEGGT